MRVWVCDLQKLVHKLTQNTTSRDSSETVIFQTAADTINLQKERTRWKDERKESYRGIDERDQGLEGQNEVHESQNPAALN